MTLDSAYFPLAVAVLSNGMIASGGESPYSISIWNPVTKSVVKTFIGHTNNIQTLIQIKNGLVLSGSKDKTIKVWNISNQTFSKSLLLASGVQVLTELSNNLIAVGLSNSMIQLWNISAGTLNSSLILYTKSGISIGFILELSQNQLASSDNFAWIKILSLTKATTINVISSSYGMSAICLFSNNTFASFDGFTISIWTRDGVLIKTLSTRYSNYYSNSLYGYPIIQLNNNILAAVSSSYGISIWNIDTGKLVNTLVGHTNEITSMVANNSNTIVSCSLDSSLKIWSEHFFNMNFELIIILNNKNYSFNSAQLIWNVSIKLNIIIKLFKKKYLILIKINNKI